MTDNTAWYLTSAANICESSKTAAHTHQQQLTKPPGSLGLLESLAVQFAGYQRCATPVLKQIHVVVFAADHGVCAHGVSAFPQVVTGQMVANFAAGGGAINVLCRRLQAALHVVNVGTVEPLPPLSGVIDRRIAAGTADLSLGPAMTAPQCLRALEIGREQVQEHHSDSVHLCIGGEMGIGNTTSAAAIYSALLGLSAAHTVGPGTGVDEQGIQIKQQVIEQALMMHQQVLNDPLQVLICLGGFEIAALTGFYIASAQMGFPVLVDGFISTAAALMAVAINPSVQPWFLYAHRSAEPAHNLALAKLEASPLLDLGMRLGEGSGAALAVPLIQSALSLHSEMATFADAGVDND